MKNKILQKNTEQIMFTQTIQIIRDLKLQQSIIIIEITQFLDEICDKLVPTTFNAFFQTYHQDEHDRKLHSRTPYTDNAIEITKGVNHTLF